MDPVIPILLEKFCRNRKSIAALYMFGSTATGHDRRGSDIDLAIVIKKTVSGKERIRLETTISNLLHRDVDLVVFGQASPLLQHQILKYGRLVCENDASERVRQEVLARAEYLDTRFLFREISA
jgi:uncharacterized protein